MYQTEQLQLTIEPFKIQLLQITNIDELYQELITKGDDHKDVRDERIPYWAELWPSAIALSRFLIQSKSIHPNSTVLEIGCGLGLPSIIAAKLGANVTMTDYLPAALTFAEKNCILNHLPQVQFELLDWRLPKKELAADILLASDVAYEARMFDYLIQAFQTLCKPQGKIILSEPNRLFAKTFFERLSKQKFDVEKTQIPVEMRNLSYMINIFILNLK